MIGAMAVLGVVAIAEIWLRIRVPNRPKVNRLDPVLGWRSRPGLRYHYGREGEADVAINKAGFRDVDHPLKKAPGCFRVAVLGDSVVEAREVPLRDTFWKRLEEPLSALLQRPVEVLNFGVNGYSTAQSLLTLERHVFRYDVDFVVQVFFTGTDVTSNLFALGRHRDRPYFEAGQDGVRLLSTAGDTPGFRLRFIKDGVRVFFYDHLRLLQEFRELRIRDKLFRRKKLGKKGEGPVIDINHGIYRTPDDPVWRQAWEVGEALLSEIARRVCRQDAGFLLVVCPNAPQTSPDPEVAPALCRALGVGDLDYPERRLRDFAAGAGLPFLALVDPLREAAAARGEPMYGDGIHLNAAGHRVAAEVIARAIGKLVEGAERA